MTMDFEKIDSHLCINIGILSTISINLLNSLISRIVVENKGEFLILIYLLAKNCRLKRTGGSFAFVKIKLEENDYISQFHSS